MLVRVGVSLIGRQFRQITHESLTYAICSLQLDKEWLMGKTVSCVLVELKAITFE